MTPFVLLASGSPSDAPSDAGSGTKPPAKLPQYKGSAQKTPSPQPAGVPPRPSAPAPPRAQSAGTQIPRLPPGGKQVPPRPPASPATPTARPGTASTYGPRPPQFQHSRAPSALGAWLTLLALIIGAIATGAMLFLYFKNPDYWEKAWLYIVLAQFLLLFIPIGVFFTLPTVQITPPGAYTTPSAMRPTAPPPSRTPSAPKIVEIKEEDVEIIEEPSGQIVKKLGEREIISYPSGYKPTPEFITTLTLIPIDEKRMLSLKIPIPRK